MRYTLFLLLSSCAFGIIGNPNDDPTMRKQQAHPTYNNCTTDEQCGEGSFCYKTTSYVGTCAKIK